MEKREAEKDPKKKDAIFKYHWWMSGFKKTKNMQ